uniref:F-box domain-containing protein n=1 Tax=Ananas comosus var. bracteatus TaxID=296719 RepID=A0A6V7QEH7_ANACO|nr:unnamed protein product [Ananas comosus var. bracteatus]
MESEGRRWSEMAADCLSLIFRRLSLEDLAVGVPFVCKSWHRASLDPLCWTLLDFRDVDFMPWSRFSREFSDRYAVPRFSFSGFLRLCVARSRGSAVELAFPLLFGASLRDLHVAKECTKLRKVILPNLASEDEPHLPEIVAKWGELEWLEMESKPSSFSETAAQIGRSSNSVVGLKMHGSIKKEDAAVIVDRLPDLKFLCLSRSYLPREELSAIVHGCKNLERLCARDCVGFEADEEVVKWCSGIKSFEHEGSKVFDEFGYDTDECDPLYVHVI